MPRLSKSRTKLARKNHPQFLESLETRRLLCTSQDTAAWHMTELRPDLYRQALIDQAARLLAAGPQYGVASSSIKGAKGTTAGSSATAGKTGTGAKAPAVAAAADIVWVNRGTKVDESGGTDGDGFYAQFGSNAAKARGVVDAVITMYERMIGSFNYSDGTSNFNLTLSMNGTGFGAGAGAGTTVGGKPKSGTIQMGSGNGTAPTGGAGSDRGWFMDPTPFDNSEFMGVVQSEFAAKAQSLSPANGKNDFLTVVEAEMTHTMGQFGNINGLWNAMTTNTGVADAAHPGTLWVFRGPSVKHLFSSDNGGSASSFAAVHTADPQAALTFQSDTYSSTDDQGNAFYEGSTRYLVDNLHALLFKDAFAYSTVDPAQYGTMYDVLNQTTGVVTVRGGDAVTNRTNSNDVVSITRSGNTITISEDIGNDVAATGALPGEGNLPAFVTQYDISQVTSISISTGDGNDTISIASNLGVPVSVNAGAGTDQVIATGTAAADTINVQAGTLTGDMNATLTGVESLVVNAGDNADNINFIGSGMVPTTINGEGGDDSLTVTLATVSGFAYDGGGGTNRLTINATASSESFGITSSIITGNATIGLSSVQDFVLNAGDGSDNAVLDPTGFTHVTLNGGDGNDTFTVNNPGNSFMTLDGGNDSDSLSVNGTASSESFNISATGISGSTSMGTNAIEFLNLNSDAGDDSIGVAASTTMSLSLNGGGDVDHVTFTGSAGSDVYNVAADSTVSGAATVTFVYGIEGFIFNCGDSDDTVNSLACPTPTTINGGNGNDSLVLTGTVDANSIAISANAVQGDFLINSIGNDVENLTVNAGDGDDAITFNGAGNVRATTINGEGDNDTLTLTNANGASPVYLGGAGANVLTLMSGNYTVSNDLGASGTDMTANVSGAGTLTFASTQHLTALNVTGNASSKAAVAVGGNKVLVTNDLTISNGGQLDLFDNDMIVYYTGSSPLAGVTSLIRTGRNAGAWNGAGIISTSAQTRQNLDTTLGSMNFSDYTFGSNFSGETVTGSAVLVKYTYYGDANFNGKVDGADYARIDVNYGLQSSQGNIGGWINGDFDGNGKIDGSDYGAIDHAFGTQSEIL